MEESETPEPQIQMQSICQLGECKFTDEDTALLENADDALNHLKLSRKRSIIVLREMARQFAELFKKDKALELSGCASGLTGGVLGIAGGAISIATAGAAIPFLVGGLLTAGTVTAVAGGAAKVGNKITTQHREAELLQKLESILKEDILLHDFLGHALAAMKTSQRLSDSAFQVNMSASEQLQSGDGCGMSQITGALQLGKEILAHFKPLKEMLNLDGAIKTLIETIVVVASDSIIKATTTATETVVRVAAAGGSSAIRSSSGGKLGLDMAIKSVQESVETATKRAVPVLVKATPEAVAFESKGANAALTYGAFAKGGEEAAVESSKVIATTTAKEVAKTAAVVTGG
eukprot:maker-scaffold553_size137994-snap-gene-0.16 protein:Tk12059 transcript:maker-scaffold553_size137994-snap-gene-0.16-mRNA-1 annotation:"apolipoprotein l3-like isoform x1"